MGVKRIGVLLKKEFVYGSKGFIFLVIFAPILMTVVVTLVFGDLTFAKPTAGVFAEESSGLAAYLEEESSIRLVRFSSRSGLLDGVRSGDVDVGIVVPKEFDLSTQNGEKPSAEMFFFGESYAKDRMIVGAAFLRYGRTIAGQEPAFSIESVVLGEETDLPWNERLLPFMVLLTILMSGIFLAGTSVIAEKERGTLHALIVSPAQISEIFTAKGTLAFIVCMLMGVVILILNSSFGAKPVLLITIIALGAIMSVTIGLMLGAALRDVSGLFAIWKSASIVLFAPGIIYMFPRIPQWIGKIFPTYYLIAPINEINLRGAGWNEVSLNLFVLIVIDAALISLLAVQLHRARKVLSL